MPVRDVPEVFGATVKETNPVPLPLVVEPSVIQLALLVVVHGHPAETVMTILPDPPAAPNDATNGEYDIWQLALDGGGVDGDGSCGEGAGVGDEGVGDDGVGDEGAGDEGVGDDGAGAPPAWVTVNVWVAILNVAVRGVLVVFAVNANPIVPAPVPLPAVTISQDAELVVAQLHDRSVVTPTVPVPAAEPNDADAVTRV